MQERQSNLDEHRTAQCILTGGYLPRGQLFAAISINTHTKKKLPIQAEASHGCDAILYTSTLCSSINCLNFDKRSEVLTVAISTV